jgi:phosphatidylserine decarboxylase
MGTVSYILRKTGERCTESVMGDGALKFAYETALGRSLWCILFRNGWLSALMGKYYDSTASKKAIQSLASIPGCTPDEAEKPLDDYASFNEFFTRHLKPGARPVPADESVFLSPGDGRLLVYPSIKASDPVPVKGAKRTLSELCNGDLPEKEYAAAVLRLAPVDYHRYHYPCACRQAAMPVRIPGKYHSVNPIALKKRPDLFVENARCITKLESDLFGTVWMLEVGAFGVGTMVETGGCGDHKRMDEKGYFKFGGSTVILIMEKDKFGFDEDLIRNSSEGMETLVKCGESLGFPIK